MAKSIAVTVWNEFRHEKSDVAIGKLYPKGMHAEIAKSLNAQTGIVAKLAALDDPEHGLSEKALAETDVLIWWGHMAHGEVKDEIAARVAVHVRSGMGLIVLHSGHVSKPFLKLMGTTGSLCWREVGEREVLWAVDPTHPIAQGLPTPFVLEHEEMYGEPFDVPTPDELVFISNFAGGEVFRSGCVWRRGLGKVFYFRPGHETYPTYFDANVLTVIANGVRYVAPKLAREKLSCPNRAMDWFVK
jgi:trehalose utilization protein